MEQCWDLCEAVCSVAREEMDSISDEGLMFSCEIRQTRNMVTNCLPNYIAVIIHAY